MSEGQKAYANSNQSAKTSIAIFVRRLTFELLILLKQTVFYYYEQYILMAISQLFLIFLDIFKKTS